MMDMFTDAERLALSPYVSNLDSPIFALRHLPEEVVAVLFAYYSRSPHSLRRNLLRLLEEGDLDLSPAAGADREPDDTDRLASARDKARAFHEKWVVGYGHSSVAEHGCVHLALEDISIIASKLVEDGRLASYTEKSTRYVAFDPSKMHYPPRVMAQPDLALAYQNTVQALLSAYAGWTENFVCQIKALAPCTPKQTERGHDSASRATAFDTLRYLLPAATHTNIGLTLNARALEHLITKLLSQPLEEGQHLGARLKAEAQHIVPTLLKYADRNEYRADTPPHIAQLAYSLLPPPAPAHGQEGRAESSSVTLISIDPQAEDTLVASILYEHAARPMTALLAQVRLMDMSAKEQVIDAYLARRGRHDAPGRALERIGCTLELQMDYGAYRDVQRHRMATQSLQPLCPDLGYATPPLMVQFGCGAQYQDLMQMAQDTYTQIHAAGLADEAAYILPLATRIRTLFTWNLRELAHFIELRSARQGHPAYRRVAQDAYHALAQAQPLIARYLRPNLNDYALTRE